MRIGDFMVAEAAGGLKASDIESDKYRGYQMMISPSGTPAVLMKSKSVIPTRWCVAYDSITLFFKSRRSAIEYCRLHGFKDEHGKAL